MPHLQLHFVGCDSALEFGTVDILLTIVSNVDQS